MKGFDVMKIIRNIILSLGIFFIIIISATIIITVVGLLYLKLGPDDEVKRLLSQLDGYNLGESDFQLYENRIYNKDSNDKLNYKMSTYMLRDIEKNKFILYRVDKCFDIKSEKIIYLIGQLESDFGQRAYVVLDYHHNQYKLYTTLEKIPTKDRKIFDQQKNFLNVEEYIKRNESL